MYYDRNSKKLEKGYDGGGKALSILYNTHSGRFVLWSFAARPWFSKLVTTYHHSRLSHKDIGKFIDKHHIDVDKEFAKQQYKSFNDFFTRQKAVMCTCDEQALVAPADSKMRFFPITEDLALHIKNSTYSIEDILCDSEMAQKFQGGTCVVFRLGVDDYHRYHFIDSGTILSNKRIPGKLHTVRPVSERYHVFTRNAREVTMMQTDHFGTVAHVEVGALLVGKIQNHDIDEFNRMEEKGYFEFGGSTIVMLFNAPIAFDEDIVKANEQGYEVKVHAGEKIGYLK